MTNDNYESDLTDEEHNELVLMSEHAITPPLSPGATAVLQAYRSTHLSINNLAAALRAVADLDETLFDVNEEWMPAVRAVRTETLLAIAAELDGSAH